MAYGRWNSVKHFKIILSALNFLTFHCFTLPNKENSSVRWKSCHNKTTNEIFWMAAAWINCKKHLRNPAVESGPQYGI